MKVFVAGVLMVVMSLFVEAAFLAIGAPEWLARNTMYGLMLGGMTLCLSEFLRSTA